MSGSPRTARVGKEIARQPGAFPLFCDGRETSVCKPAVALDADRRRKALIDLSNEQEKLVKLARRFTLYALLTEDDAAKGLDPGLLTALRGTVLGSRQHRALRSILMARLFT